ncbi:MAG TPA: hypothetical protein VLG47_01845 [Candidatus Saccharimonadales bacterium]|nr:hypothetical protein [Candidatus Saccharimonadales bacterium]
MKKGDKKPVITICSSSSFYKQANDLQEELEKMGYEVLVPNMATAMKLENNYERKFYQPWLDDPTQYDVKADLMRGHFDKVAKADAVLIINGEKNGQKNYIGGNVLMEMGLAFHLGLPIYIFYDVPEESKLMEEIRGMLPILMKGDVQKFPAPEKIGSKAGA